MTTPAKNDDIPTYGPAYRHTFRNEDLFMGNRVQSRLTDVRPASSNAPRSGKFKLCQGWEHSGGLVSKSSSTHRYYQGDPSVWFIDSGNIWGGDLNDIPTLMPSSNLVNSCLVKALAKLKSQDVHVGNFVAEADKTLEMVSHNAKSIARQVTRFRKSYPKLWPIVKATEGVVPRHDWCLIPDKWLELQYGWKPLLQDIYGAVHHLSNRSRFSKPYVRVTAEASDSDFSYTYHTSVAAAECRVTWKSDQKVNIFLIYGMTSPLLAEISSLGLVNPLEIIWETTKYSFVVDWFLPVSNWLSSLTADFGYEFITGGNSQTSTSTFASSVITATGGSNTYLEISPLKCNGQLKRMTRSCYASSPVPGLYVKNPLSSAHMANALALLAQAFR